MMMMGDWQLFVWLHPECQNLFFSSRPTDTASDAACIVCSSKLPLALLTDCNRAIHLQTIIITSLCLCFLDHALNALKSILKLFCPSNCWNKEFNKEFRLIVAAIEFASFSVLFRNTWTSHQTPRAELLESWVREQLGTTKLVLATWWHSGAQLANNDDVYADKWSLAVRSPELDENCPRAVRERPTWRPHHSHSRGTFSILAYSKPNPALKVFLIPRLDAFTPHPAAQQGARINSFRIACSSSPLVQAPVVCSVHLHKRSV